MAPFLVDKSTRLMLLDLANQYMENGCICKYVN